MEEKPPRPVPEIKPAAALTDTLRERLFNTRTLVISGEINQELASHVIAQLIALDADSARPITIFINSQGGHVESGDTVHDIVRFIRAPVRMIGTGWVASAAANIFIAAPRERRFCLPNTRFLLHQPAGGVGGSASDIEIEAREILRMRERIVRLIARETGQSIERVQNDIRRNFWLDANAALEYGLVGRIIQHADDVPEEG
jgi:ATP-dependent Clp protease protease subunit